MKRRHPEDLLQRSVVDCLTRAGVPGMVFFAVPNGGKRSKIEAAIMKGLGVKAGVSDLILFHKSKFYALELKADGGKPTALQQQFLDQVKASGGEAFCAVGIQEAFYVLSFWGLVRFTWMEPERAA